MVDRTITAANAVYMLTVRGLFSGQRLQGFGTDTAFETEAAEPAEVVKGVDGIMSAGYVPFITQQTITLQADSPSMQLFEDWLANQKRLGEIMYADAVIILPSIQRKYTGTKGVLSSAVQIAGTQKVLQARPFRISWDSLDPSPV